MVIVVCHLLATCQNATVIRYGKNWKYKQIISTQKTETMIEIKKRNGNWEAYVNGGLLHYSESLEGLLNYLARHGEDLEEELNNE